MPGFSRALEGAFPAAAGQKLRRFAMGFSGFLRIIRGKAGIPVLFVSAALLISPGSAAENEVSDRFSGGAGVEGDPYIVETVEQLQEIKTTLTGIFCSARILTLPPRRNGTFKIAMKAW